MLRILSGVVLVSGTVLAAPTAAVNLRVMSFNIQHGNAGVSTLAAFIADQSPDVVGLQEVHSYQTAGFESELERLTGVAWYAVWAPVGGGKTEGNLLLSRHPYLSSSYKEIGPSSWGGNRTAARGEIVVDGVAIQIFNTHLDWNPDGDTTNRTTNLTQLLDWAATFPAPRMLIGDFNSRYDTWWITETKKDYTDTYEDVTGNPSGPATHENGGRIDYIFRSKASASLFVPTAAWVVSTTLSDHRPMMTDFSVAGSAAQAPYGGAAAGLPGTVQAENFDTGGAGVAYHDTTSGNTGGAYRGESVDLEATTDAGGGYNVGWIAAGEWLEYTVDVASSGTYTIEARVACSGPGGAFRIEFGGVNKTGTLWIPDTGSWQAWRTVSASGVSLSAGVQVMRVVFEAAGSTGKVGNLNHVRVVAPTSTQSPYSGTPVVLPGTVQAENFDLGGQNVAYYDNTSTNKGGQYRTTEAVDIEACAEGGYNVGWNSAGEWLEYAVEVPTAGSYLLDVRVAANGSGGTFHVEFDGVDKTGPLTIPNTGGWQSWRTLTAEVSLSAGIQVMRIAMDANGATGSVGNLNYVAIRGGTGLRGEYFDDTTLTTLRTTRIDPTVNFDWGLNAPHALVEAETFSVRWTGRVVPRYSETYTFTTRTDDGVRLWVNGVLLVDDWTLHSATERSGMISLAAGRAYDLRMEYFDNLYNAVAQLSWSSPSQPKQNIPKDRLFPPSTSASTARVLAVGEELSADSGAEGGRCGVLGLEVLLLLALLGAVKLTRSL